MNNTPRDQPERAHAAPSAVVADQRRVYGLQVLPPVVALAELTAIVLVILLADWIWPNLEINNFQPSPYWIPVLLLSLQYGTVSGSLAAIVAVAAYFALANLPEQGVGENEFAFRLRVLAQPILWIAAAVGLGQFRMVQIAAKQDLQFKVEELGRQRASLADFANRLRARCDGLEREIAGRPSAEPAHLLGALSALRRPGPQFPAAFAAVLGDILPGAEASVFERTGARLDVVANLGWSGDSRWARTLDREHGIYRAIVEQGRGLSVLNDGDETALAGQGIAAVAICSPSSPRIIGMLKIEALPPEALTPTLPDALDILALAMAPALEGLDRTSDVIRPKAVR